jgi:hypothetical protein
MPDAGCPVFFTASSVLYCQQCTLLPAVYFTASSVLYCQQCTLLPNVLKHGFYSRRFSDRYLSGQEHLDPESLSQDSLDSEIAMLRIITRRVIDLSTGVEDLETVSRLLALLSLVSGRITAMQRVQVHLASNQLDE